jgi:histidine ammonia-lyase
LNIALEGLAVYAVSAEKTAASWTNFYAADARPSSLDSALVKPYVLARIKGILCDPSLDADVQAKLDPAAKIAAQSGLDALRLTAKEALAPAAFTDVELSCVGI